MAPSHSCSKKESVKGSAVPSPLGLSSGRRLVSGQVLLITVLTLGGTLLGATTIAGLLLVYQIRQATDISNSARAVYAADTGIEWGLYQFFNPSLAPSHAAPQLSNQASFTTTCVGGSGCSDGDNTKAIRAVGSAAGVTRAFEFDLRE
jgi:hypothetical protein